MLTITISLIKSPENTYNLQDEMVFEGGGTIGRSTNNTWVLDDPERFISGQHVQIDSQAGGYFIADLSTNGTFLNASAEPIGKGNKAPLMDGDSFSLGDYEFKVSVQGQAPAISAAGVVPTPGIHDPGPFADLSVAASPFDTPSAPFTPTVDAVSHDNAVLADVFSSTPADETDPLAMLDKAASEFSADPIESNDLMPSVSYSDGASVMDELVSIPNAIPEDWDDDFAPAVAKPEPLKLREQQPQQNDENLRELEQRIGALNAENQALKLEVQQLNERLKQQPVTSDHGGETTDIGMTLIASMGFSKHDLSHDKISEINHVAGEIIRETIAGLMQVLSSRNSIKNELRMNVTTIRPVENNPLKFSVNIDDAMENIFIKEGNAYQAPVEAIREGFVSIAEHQIAVLAGIRAALKSGIEKFDPIALEQRFDKYGKSGLIQMRAKARRWDLYKDYYSELVGDMDDSFRHLFGDEFVQAYEEQLHKLAMSRKNSPEKT